MILSRSLRLMNFKEPDEEEECLEGNLKFGCIFDYKGRVLVSNQNLKTVVTNTQDVLRKYLNSPLIVYDERNKIEFYVLDKNKKLLVFDESLFVFLIGVGEFCRIYIKSFNNSISVL